MVWETSGQLDAKNEPISDNLNIVQSKDLNQKYHKAVYLVLGLDSWNVILHIVVRGFDLPHIMFI